MKPRWLITGNSEHVKATLITGEQYLRGQLSKNRQKDMLGDILKHFENHLQLGSDIAHTEANQDV